MSTQSKSLKDGHTWDDHKSTTESFLSWHTDEKITEALVSRTTTKKGNMPNLDFSDCENKHMQMNFLCALCLIQEITINQVECESVSMLCSHRLLPQGLTYQMKWTFMERKPRICFKSHFSSTCMVESACTRDMIVAASVKISSICQ